MHAVMPRQRCISDEGLFEMLASGKRQKQIAGELQVCEDTVRRLVSDAVERAGAKTPCQAVAMYVKTKKNAA